MEKSVWQSDLYFKTYLLDINIKYKQYQKEPKKTGRARQMLESA